jgi:ABC-2 type transport system ATP-binding protein
MEGSGYSGRGGSAESEKTRFDKGEHLGVVSDPAMIEAVGLTKYYGSFAAVRGVTFSVSTGEVVAFLGPNAAGKTTTMRMLTGFLSPSAGEARVAGMDVAVHRIGAAAHVGYLPEDGPLYTDMTPEAILDFFGQARGMSRPLVLRRREEVVRLCALDDVLGKRISKLSRGYRQRVGLAVTLLHEPDVLILDEPTNGLDPNQIRQVRDMLSRIGREKTILLSTHVLQEVEAIATRVLMIAEGQLVFDGTPQELADKGGEKGMEGAFRRLTQPSSGRDRN